MSLTDEDITTELHRTAVPTRADEDRDVGGSGDADSQDEGDADTTDSTDTDTTDATDADTTDSCRPRVPGRRGGPGPGGPVPYRSSAGDG